MERNPYLYLFLPTMICISVLGEKIDQSTAKKRSVIDYSSKKYKYKIKKIIFDLSIPSSSSQKS